ncbi:MAG: YbdD/YjiX family protein [Steroidobacteraceae bacterium]
MANGSSNPVRQFLSSGLSLLRGVTGDDAYEKYVAHMHSREPATAPMSARDFYKAQMEQKWNCISGCC